MATVEQACSFATTDDGHGVFHVQIPPKILQKRSRWSSLALQRFVVSDPFPTVMAGWGVVFQQPITRDTAATIAIDVDDRGFASVTHVEVEVPPTLAPCEYDAELDVYSLQHGGEHGLSVPWPAPRTMVGTSANILASEVALEPVTATTFRVTGGGISAPATDTGLFLFTPPALPATSMLGVLRHLASTIQAALMLDVDAQIDGGIRLVTQHNDTTFHVSFSGCESWMQTCNTVTIDSKNGRTALLRTPVSLLEFPMGTPDATSVAALLSAGCGLVQREPIAHVATIMDPWGAVLDIGWPAGVFSRQTLATVWSQQVSDAQVATAGSADLVHPIVCLWDEGSHTYRIHSDGGGGVGVEWTAAGLPVARAMGMDVRSRANQVTVSGRQLPQSHAGFQVAARVPSGSTARVHVEPHFGGGPIHAVLSATPDAGRTPSLETKWWQRSTASFERIHHGFAIHDVVCVDVPSRTKRVTGTVVAIPDAFHVQLQVADGALVSGDAVILQPLAALLGAGAAMRFPANVPVAQLSPLLRACDSSIGLGSAVTSKRDIPLDGPRAAQWHGGSLPCGVATRAAWPVVVCLRDIGDRRGVATSTHGATADTLAEFTLGTASSCTSGPHMMLGVGVRGESVPESLSLEVLHADTFLPVSFGQRTASMVIEFGTTSR